MTYAEDIAIEEANIANLQNQMRGLKIPQRTINYQMTNLSQGNRAFKQSAIITKRFRKQLQSQITSSQSKIISLRDAIFGEA